ncbi:MAG: lipoate--protein ligase family protein [Nitrospinae bacterium]|nr:lipoate--protein ligase family protein [Nitrospinota bacterium]
MNNSKNISHCNDWRLILDNDDNDGFYNMSADEAILYSLEEGLSPPTLRIYGWRRPTMTIGYAQDIETTIKIDYCLEKGIDIVRRITGGRGILHQGEITYSIVAPKNALADGSISGIYTVIKETLRTTFSSLGVPVDMSADKKRGIGGGACFGAAYRHEITIGGKKIMGGALRRLKTCFLYHGSILLEKNSEELTKTLRFDSEGEEEEYIDSLNKGIIGINDILDKPLSRPVIEAAIIESFSTSLGLNFYCSETTDFEKNKISRLVSKKRELMPNMIIGK